MEHSIKLRQYSTAALGRIISKVSHMSARTTAHKPISCLHLCSTLIIIIVKRRAWLLTPTIKSNKATNRTKRKFRSEWALCTLLQNAHYDFTVVSMPQRKRSSPSWLLFSLSSSFSFYFSWSMKKNILTRINDAFNRNNGHLKLHTKES